VTLESPQAAAGARSRATLGSSELPHLDSLIQTTTDELSATWGKSNRVNAVPVTNVPFETLGNMAIDLPYTDALVERASGDISVVWRDGNGSDSIINEELKHLLVSFQIPQTNRTISTSRCNQTTISRIVKRVDVLLVTSERGLDSTGANVPNLKKTLLAKIDTEIYTANPQLLLEGTRQ
jgi:hypothetical protein